MQVERQRVLRDAGERRTGEEHVGIYLLVGDNLGKLKVIPHYPYGGKQGTFGPCADR